MLHSTMIWTKASEVTTMTLRITSSNLDHRSGQPATSPPASDRAAGAGGFVGATDGRNNDQGRKSHVRFLGGGGAAMRCCYPTDSVSTTAPYALLRIFWVNFGEQKRVRFRERQEKCRPLQHINIVNQILSTP